MDWKTPHQPTYLMQFQSKWQQGFCVYIQGDSRIHMERQWI